MKTKKVTFRQSLLVDNEITVEVPIDWNSEEVRAMCEDYPVTVTVDNNHDDGDDVVFEGLVVVSAIGQSDFEILTVEA